MMPPRQYQPFLHTHALLCILTVIFFTGCKQSNETSQPSATHDAPDNVLFIILDAFDAGHVTHLGYERDTTPNLDRIAATGITFTQAYSQSANTNSSTSSFLTGQYPPAPATSGSIYSIHPTDYTLAQAFLDKGFHTAAFTANPYINPGIGYDQGFQEFKHVHPLIKKDPKRTHRGRVPKAAVNLLHYAGNWISANAETPWFCYVHLLRPHNPYTALPPFENKYAAHSQYNDPEKHEAELTATLTYRNTTPGPDDIPFLNDRYDANIAYVDDLVRKFLQALKDLGELESTLVIIASDHGEAFWQHNKIMHNNTVYEEMTHVPLILHAPQDFELKSQVIDTPVEMVDIYPTLVDIFGLSPTNPLHGKSLLSLMRGKTTAHKDALFSQTQRTEYVSVRIDDKKVIFAQGPGHTFEPFELYDLAADPGEKKNLLYFDEVPLDSFKAHMERYKTEYFLRPIGEAGELTEEQQEALGALGYVE